MSEVTFKDTKFHVLYLMETEGLVAQDIQVTYQNIIT